MLSIKDTVYYLSSRFSKQWHREKLAEIQTEEALRRIEGIEFLAGSVTRTVSIWGFK